jgi:hypothetical protein
VFDKQTMAMVVVLPLGVLLSYVRMQRYDSKNFHMLILGGGLAISSCLLLPGATQGENATLIAIALYGAVSALWALRAVMQPET